VTAENEVQEKRVRRVARRQGRTITKSRSSDPNLKGTYSVSEAWFGAGGTYLTLDEAESHLVGEVAQKAEAEFDELKELLLQRAGGQLELDSLSPESVTIYAYDSEDATAFTKRYTKATGAHVDVVESPAGRGRPAGYYGVGMTLDQPAALIAWLRTLPEPKESLSAAAPQTRQDLTLSP